MLFEYNFNTEYYVQDMSNNSTTNRNIIHSSSSKHECISFASSHKIKNLVVCKANGINYQEVYKNYIK